jgi:hypothetical protein
LIIGWSITSFIQKKSTLKTYKSILSKLTAQFGEKDLNSLTPEEVLSFLTGFNHTTRPHEASERGLIRSRMVLQIPQKEKLGVAKSNFVID